MNLEPVMQSELSQKEKDKYHILMHIYIYMESRKMVLINQFGESQQRCRHTEQTCGHSGGRRGSDELTELALNLIHYHM